MPPLETARLRMRPLTIEDAPFMLRLCNEPGYQRFIRDEGVRTLEQARTFIEEKHLPQYTDGLGMYRVSLRQGDEPVGVCGIIKREGMKEVEVGFAFLAAHRGQGYGVEAARGSMAHAKRLGYTRVVALTDPQNHRSGHLLAKLGLGVAGQITLAGADQPSLLYTPEAQEEPMYGRFGTFQAQPGQRGALIDILLRAAALVGETHDCITYEVSASTSDEVTICIYETWRSKEAHGASLRDAAVLALIGEARPLIAGMGAAQEFEVKGGYG